MNRRSMAVPTLLVAVSIVMIGCSPADEDLWFAGNLAQATAKAAEQESLVFVEFYTDWCSWCRRLESETLTDPEVRRGLADFITIRLNAEKDGAAAASEFNVESYPTMIFIDPSGEEVERIVGYLPPDKFLSEVERISAGDTLYACLQRLQSDPTNADVMKRVVDGLLERSDPEGALAKIEVFHNQEGHDHELCTWLTFLAGRDLHYRVYLRAARLYREAWETSLEVAPGPGSERLSRLLEAGLPDLDPAEQATRMRQARLDDAADLLALVDLDTAVGDDLFELAEFAFRGGHYELAANLYRRWFDDPGTAHSAEALNRAAWQLYLAGLSLDTAVAMSRQAYELDPSADIADTLARVLYINGAAAEAIELERTASEKADGERAEQYRKATETMEAGGVLGDEPAFESYPGPLEPEPSSDTGA